MRTRQNVGSDAGKIKQNNVVDDALQAFPVNGVCKALTVKLLGI